MGLATERVTEAEARASTDLMFSAVPKEVVHVVWDRASSILTKAAKTTHGRYEIEDIRARIDSGHYVLWVVMDGEEVIVALITCVVEYPQRNAMNIEFMAGERMWEWLAMVMETLIRYSRANGCKHVELRGRPAWTKVLKKYGFEAEQVNYMLEL